LADIQNGREIGDHAPRVTISSIQRLLDRNKSGFVVSESFRRLPDGELYRFITLKKRGQIIIAVSGKDGQVFPKDLLRRDIPFFADITGISGYQYKEEVLCLKK